ncbi:MAG: hypothetical protein JNJ53_11070 [Rhizobiales bacterium]|nr:hypothetical protein [Hyphomicrobiales bacterium]
MDAHRQSSEALLDLVRQGKACVADNMAATVHCRLGPLSFAVVSNSAALCERLTRCLVKGGTGEDLTITLLSGSHPPFAQPPAWNLPHSDDRHTERLHLSREGDLSALYNPDFEQWTILDQMRRQGLMWVARDEQIPFWEEGAPFKLILHWFLGPTRLCLVHGGIVGNGRHGCMLLGPGGSGKSTTVAASFDHGLTVCGDDLALIEDCGSHWRAWGLYDALKLDPAGQKPMPTRLAEAASVPCGDKRLLRYSDLAPDRFAKTMNLTALVQCVVAHTPFTAIKPASPAAILRALAPPTIFLLRGREDTTLTKIGKLVRSLPGYRLELGDDPAEAAAALQGWLDGAERAA